MCFISQGCTSFFFLSYHGGSEGNRGAGLAIIGNPNLPLTQLLVACVPLLTKTYNVEHRGMGFTMVRRRV